MKLSVNTYITVDQFWLSLPIIIVKENTNRLMSNTGSNDTKRKATRTKRKKKKKTLKGPNVTLFFRNHGSIYEKQK